MSSMSRTISVLANFNVFVGFFFVVVHVIVRCIFVLNNLCDNLRANYSYDGALRSNCNKNKYIKYLMLRSIVVALYKTCMKLNWTSHVIALSCFLRYPIIEDARAFASQANEAAHPCSPHITSL